MKKFLLLILALIFSFSLVACDGCNDGDDDPNTPPTVPQIVVSISFESSAIEMELYDSMKLDPMVKGTVSEPTYATSDASIVTVDSIGNVVALKEGSATITATVDEKSATCTITVVDRGALPAIEFTDATIADSKEVRTIAVGDTFNLPIRVTFKGKPVESSLTVTSLNENVVAVTGEAIFGKGEGSTEITIRGEYLGKSVVKTVTVIVIP
jgi:hypothetical protein